jgi:hypothetical protein
MVIAIEPEWYKTSEKTGRQIHWLKLSSNALNDKVRSGPEKQYQIRLLLSSQSMFYVRICFYNPCYVPG